MLMLDTWLWFIAENAMEQLATGLNKAAQAMQTEEAEAEVGGPPASSDLGNLEDRQLFQLLEEAYDYRGGTKDRDGKSEMFRVSPYFTVLTLLLQWYSLVALDQKIFPTLENRANNYN